MISLKWMTTLLALGMTLSVTAETQRTVFTVENQFPRWEQIEVGAVYNFRERATGFTSADIYEISPYIRYGFREHIALQLNVPYVEVDPTFGPSNSGIGDVSLTIQLRAYEDIFGYPYFIPHLTVTFPTGDEDKGLGAGDATVKAGISYGDKIYNHLSYVIDGSYRIRPDNDNQFIFSLSVLWHVSPQLDFILEARYQDEGDFDEGDVFLFLGGMIYDWTENLQMGVHAGTGSSGDTDAIAQIRFSYTF